MAQALRSTHVPQHHVPRTPAPRPLASPPEGTVGRRCSLRGSRRPPAACPERRSNGERASRAGPPRGDLHACQRVPGVPAGRAGPGLSARTHAHLILRPGRRLQPGVLGLRPRGGTRSCGAGWAAGLSCPKRELAEALGLGQVWGRACLGEDAGWVAGQEG